VDLPSAKRSAALEETALERDPQAQAANPDLAVTESAHPLVALLTELLRRIIADLPGALGAAVTVRRHGGPLTVLAAEGIAEYLVPAQARLFGGPVPDADRFDEPVRTDHALTDPRWPALTLSNLTTRFPGLADKWSQVAGIAALPSAWDDTGTLVLSVTLDRPAEQTALRVLERYEKLVAMTLVINEAGTAGATERMIELLQSRAAIEEAKGAIIAVCRCSPEHAWHTLRRGSQELNVKLRELAVALIEHLGNAAPPHPHGVPPIIPGTAAREAAAAFWAALTLPA
jgi:hypothetical protein